MMLSRMDQDRDLPLNHGQIGEGWRAPCGCVAGAPYWGTASPPPPAVHHLLWGAALCWAGVSLCCTEES